MVLTAQQRLAVERAVGIGVRWAVRGSCDLLRGNVVAELHAVTRDGVVLGTVLAAAEMDGWRQYRTLAEIYRDAGADEHVAQPRPRFARLTGSRDQSSTGSTGTDGAEMPQQQHHPPVPDETGGPGGLFTGPQTCAARSRLSGPEVIPMLCALLLVLGVIAAGVVATWPNIRRAVEGAAGGPAGQSAPGGASAPQRTPQTLEGLLTVQLVAGEITGRQYRHAMATLAARDAERHPLDVPPEVTPPDAA